VLGGSSLGGFVALHAAARQARARREHQSVRCPIDRLVLLAPALAFGRSAFGELDAAGLAEWKRTDRFDVFHHAYNAVLPIGFAIYEDARQYDSFADPPRIPMLIVQGRRDAVVEPAMVKRFAIRHPSASLRMVDDDHQLSASLNLIWREMAAFLGLCGV
jgi:pimeloyl-ACP methyl ester carboxylesterase